MADTQTLTDHRMGRRVHLLQTSAYALRQHAINGSADLEAWQLARRMRDAASLQQCNALERELDIYLHRNPLDLTKIA